MKFYKPTLRLSHYTKVTLPLLKEMGIKGIITDLDDTLAPRNTFLPDEEVCRWVKELTEGGIRICIVSNNHKKRTKDFADPLGVPFYYRAGKPSKKWIFKALETLQLTKDEVVLLGDQLFTDMAAANRCNMKSVLVDPVGTYGGWFVQFKRKMEIPLRKKIPYYEK
ncbi:MAG: YqeG family HAD IIIA-type phosphatase [Clostridia bacterium]|nr:YqeG family HAD IIIA-type phosphatase [Clostridia bacterium]